MVKKPTRRKGPRGLGGQKLKWPRSRPYANEDFTAFCGAFGRVILALFNLYPDYSVQFWGPECKRGINKQERAQEKGSNVTRVLEHMMCKEKLRVFGVCSLWKRRLRWSKGCYLWKPNHCLDYYTEFYRWTGWNKRKRQNSHMLLLSKFQPDTRKKLTIRK